MRLTLRNITLLPALLAASLAVAQAPGEAPTASDDAPLSAVKILLTMKRTYGRCRSYRDTGEVVAVSLIEGGRAGTSVPFSTAFLRPGPFRFRFTDRGLGERSSDYIAWADGNEVRSWWDAQPGVRRPASLQEALGVVSGVSLGSSQRIPGLLLPGTVGATELLVAPERLSDESDRSVSCYRVKGASRATPYTITTGSITVTVESESTTWWIDRATFLLRKVEESRTLSTYRSVTTTTYEPEIDVEIPAQELSFDPPDPSPS